MHSTLGRRALRLLIALLVAVGLVVGAGPAWAGDHSDRRGATYLALGDSVPFGFRGNLPAAAYDDPRAFVGYPEIVAGDFGVRLLNASCPGETTDSFIDESAPSNGCENSFGSEIGYRDLHPLHVDYAGSQLEYAIATLKENRDIRLVTLTLGANDAFLCQRATPPCSSAADVGRVVAHVGQNVAAILHALRTEAGYPGRIVVVTYYALDYTDVQGVQGTQALDAALTAAAAANGARVADGFTAFQARASSAGGSSIAAGLVLPDDIHPTWCGQRLLAQAVEQTVGY